MSKKFMLRQGLCAIALIALFSPANGLYLTDSDLSRGVLGFLRSLESTIEMRTAWFYRHFGKNIDPSKIDRVRLCDYGDHSRMSFCSPAEDDINCSNITLSLFTFGQFMTIKAPSDINGFELSSSFLILTKQ